MSGEDSRITTTRITIIALRERQNRETTPNQSTSLMVYLTK
jgi:hypothetical protein